MSEAAPVEWEFLREFYEIEDAEAVGAFLTKHPRIVPSLQESASYVERFFPGFKRSLSVEMDEDDSPGSDNVERIYLLIAANENFDDLQTRMDRLDEEWGYELCESTNELVIIDLDYT